MSPGLPRATSPEDSLDKPELTKLCQAVGYVRALGTGPMTAHGVVLKSFAALQDQTWRSRPLSVGFLDCFGPNISTGCQPKKILNASEPIGCSQVASLCSWSVASVVLRSTRASPVRRLYDSISLPAVGRGPLAVRTVAPLSTCAAAASPMASSTQSRPPIQRSFPAGAGGGSRGVSLAASASACGTHGAPELPPRWYDRPKARQRSSHFH